MQRSPTQRQDRAEAPVPSLTQRVIPPPPLTELCGWGRYPRVQGREVRSEDLEGITAGAALTRGLGRSYGDSSLPASERDRVAGSPLADRLLAFDADTGVLRSEAGVSLLQLNRLLLPRHWFVPVSPGTQFVTLGGMVASDVHGKSHHVDGSFGEHVRALKMRVADGRVVECSEEHDRDLFRATLGGMGLTGHILEVEFRMKHIPSPWIWAETEQVADLDALVDGLKQASKEWPYTVCWIDCLATGKHTGRGIITRGRWAEPAEAPAHVPPRKLTIPIPFQFPAWFLNPLAARAFNAFYWHYGRGIRRVILHPQTFFYPLDNVRDWNRLYGTRGFTQYQCVFPVSGPDPCLHRFLARIDEHGGTPFLGVMKDCGAEGKGMLSFPRPGISFALDMPIRGARTQRLIDALNELVLAAGGRVYLTKDAFTRAEHYRAMDPRLDAWMRVRRQWDPHGRIRSAQSVRLFGDQP